MATFDRFDICAAFNLYAALWGGDGQRYENAIQVRLARIDYKPSRSEEFLCGLSENARAIYAGLVERRQSTGYVHCACCGLDAMGAEGVTMCAYCEEAGCKPHCDGCPACRGRSCQAPDHVHE